ncbi:MAG: immunity 17 family protein [Methanobacteriaceae archaeon]|jgi:hypothetical protein|nr:immunity 17 family protein [Candidatus Methanorudis spinitermitis]
MIEEITNFFTEQPQYFGIIFVCFGIFMLFAGIKNWEWLFEGPSYNLNKIEGIDNFFGRSVARIVAIIGGVMVIIAGITWYYIYTYYL